MAEYFDRMSAVADTMLAVFSVGLGLGRSHLHDVFGARPLSFVKLIDYPPTPPDGAGVNPHHDAGFLTLLLQHDAGGLQVSNPDGEWIDVPPRQDAFVVNIGEMLQEMTGNYFVATTHRVIADQHRQSSAWFHGPDLTTRLDPLPLGSAFVEAVEASPHHAGGRIHGPARRDRVRPRRDRESAGSRCVRPTAVELLLPQLSRQRRSPPPRRRRLTEPQLASQPSLV